VARSNHNKTKKKPKKIIPWRRHHLHLDVVVQKERSPCRQADEVADVIVAVLIFCRAAMKKTIPLFTFTVAEEEKEKINPQYQQI
jgi:hypothetical protein